MTQALAEEQRESPRARVVCPGSFDPVTNGHLDIISRAAGLYDEVIVAVLINVTKHSLFTRRRAGRDAEPRSPTDTATSGSSGSTACWWTSARRTASRAVIKGLRAVSDFEYEMQMAQMNYRMAKVETLFMTTNPLYSFLSSSLVKEIAKYGGDVSGLVPEIVLSRLRASASPRSRRGSRAGPEYPPGAAKLGIPRAAGRLCGRFSIALNE